MAKTQSTAEPFVSEPLSNEAEGENEAVRQYVTVHILDTPYHVDRPYTYYLPPVLTPSVQKGCFVMVPFGGGNRQTMGLVTAKLGREQLPPTLDVRRCKPVSRAVSEEFVLNEELLGVVSFISEMTFSTIGDAAKTVISAGALRKLSEKYVINADTEAAFLAQYGESACPERELYSHIKRYGGIKRSTVRVRLGQPYEAAAERLVRKGMLCRTVVLADSDNAAFVEYVAPTISKKEIEDLLENNGESRKQHGFRYRSDVYMRLLSVLLEHDGAEVDMETLQAAGVTSAAVRQMEKSGIVTRRKEQIYRNPYAEAAKAAPKDDNVLSDEQNAALGALSALYRTHEPKAALLHGVTGSGKTRVIKAMMDEVIRDGKQVIMLVPEISLTPQSVAVFCAYYGERVAVLHSGLSMGERLDVWRRAKHGLVDVVIGTRSAVFAPFERLGMIVIDEEQEHTYKSDTTPKYHARDIARFRCAKNNALMLLASATPSFESYHKAKTGAYTLIELKTRYGGAKLPHVIMADLHDDGDVTGETPLGRTLSAALADTLGREEQAILFINRRGYQKYVSCLACHEPVMCPHCSVPMTLHGYGAGAGMQDGSIRGVLICHYCGTRMPVPLACPACNKQHLKAFGCGTQRAEEEVEKRFADARVLRMDMDTTHGKFAHETILGKFREKEADILLGTQMVTKGHDFPDVTLVGVLSADAMLYSDDYRASEKTFSLLTQVIGRAGRAEKTGVAVIQTYNPDNPVLKYAASQDYVAFYQSAIGLRREMVFPPFCDILTVQFSSPEENEVMQIASAFSKELSSLTQKGGAYADVPLAVFGPFEAQIYKINEQYRIRTVIKCRLSKQTRALFAHLHSVFSAMCAGRVTMSIDVNPTNL